MQDKNSNSHNIQLALDQVDQSQGGTLETHSDKKSWAQLKKIMSPKRMALASLSVNVNNIITAPVYSTFVMIDTVFLLYTLTIIIQAQILQKPVYETWVVEAYLYNHPVMDFLFIQIAMLVVQLILVVLWLLTCYQKNALSKIKENSFISSTISVILFSLQTFLTVPYILIIIRTFIMDIDKGSLSVYISTQCINAINIILFLIIQIFLKRLATLKIPTPKVPQAELDHRTVYLRLLMKFAFAIIEVTLSKFANIKQYMNIISIFLILLTLLTCLTRLMVVPLFNRSINIMINMQNFATLVCSFIIVINAYDTTIDQLNLYYLAVLSPFLLGVSFLIEFHWQNRIFSKIRGGQTKMEVQYKYILHLLQEQLHNLKGNKTQMSDSLKFLFGILEDHNGECLRQSCLCHHAESIVWVLNQRQDENQQIIDLNSEDLDFLNTISQDILYEKELFSNAPFTFNDFHERKYTLIKSSQRQVFIKDHANKDEDDPLFQSVDFSIEDDKGEGQGENIQNNKILKVDPQKLKQAFFANFLKQFFEQGIQKFPQSVDIKVQYAYFALYYMRNVYLCINILKQIDCSKLSYLERSTYKLQEDYLINEIQNSIGKPDSYKLGFENGLLGVINQEQVKYNSSIDHSQLDSESFLDYAKLQEVFNNTTQALSKHILQFWVLLYDQVLQVDKLIIEGVQVANYIALTYDTFRMMDEASKHKNEKIFYNFAIIHQQLLNDSQTYELYIQKMKHIINMKKFIKKNYQLSDSYQDLGLLLVNGKFSSLGKILQTNKVFQKMTGYNSQDLKYSSYEVIMNDLIKKWHGIFINEFNKTGTNIILDKKLNQFIKKKNGYIMPVQLIVKNHFSKYHGFTFICFINQIKEIQLDGSLSIGIPVENLMFLLCDNYEGKIFNVSKNCASKLGLRKDYLLKNQNSLDFELKLGQLSPSLDITTIKELQHRYNCQENAYYGLIKIDLNAINQKTQSRFNVAHLVDARFKLYLEQYFHKKYEMNIVIIQIFDDKSAQQFGISNQIRQNSMLSGQNEASNVSKEENKDYEEDYASSSSTDSSKQNDQIKTQSISMEKKTPRNLKIVMQMLFIMFLTMIVVSTINLYLSKSRSQKLYKEIDVVRKSFDRITYGSRSRLMVREMLNVANGYEPNSTAILTNRMRFFRQQLFTAQEQLRQVQNYLEASMDDFSEELQNQVTSQAIPIEYLDDKAGVYTKNQTMSYLINIYVSKLLEIYNMEDSKLKGRLGVQSMSPTKAPFTPTDQETTIFFAVQNGNNVIQQYTMNIADLYTKDIKNYSEDSITQTKITILISISTIVLVFIIITPLLSMIQDRQYSSISFFLKISKTSLSKLIEQTKICYNSLYNQDYGELMEKSNKKNIAGEEPEPIGGSLDQVSSNLKDDFQNEISLYSVSVNPNLTKNEVTVSESDNLMMNRSANNNTRAKVYEVAGNNSLTSMTFDKHPGQQKSPKSAAQRRNDNDYSESSYSSRSHHDHERNKNKQNNENLKIEQDKINEAKAKEQKINEEEEEAEIMSAKIHQVLTKKKQRRARVILLAILFMTLFSLYFVGSYFMSNQTYSSVPGIIDQLNVIYFKDSCIENLMIYVKENIVQNKTYTLYEDKKTIASTYFIQRCLGIEKDYISIRKNSSDAFKQIQDFVAQVETPNICTAVYGTNQQMINSCNSAYNGILKNGLSNAVSILISNFNQLDLRFQALQQRNLTNLKMLNLDNDNLILIELKVYIMDSLFTQLKDLATNSINSYLLQQTNQFVIFFSAFILIIAVLIVIGFGFMFRRLRDFLWKINLTMKILPLDHLPRETIQDLKEFFRS